MAPLYRFKTDEEAVKMANDPDPSLPRMRGRVREGARRLFLQPRHRLHLARRRGARIRHRRHQRRHHLDRDSPVRRHEGERHRPRRLEIRHRGIPRSQIPLHGRHRPVISAIKSSPATHCGEGIPAPEFRKTPAQILVRLPPKGQVTISAGNPRWRSQLVSFEYLF